MRAKMPNDIKKYKTKFLLGFSFIQFIMLCIGLAVGVGIGVLLIVICKLDINIGMIISAIVAAPIVMSGFINIAGLNFFQGIKRIIATEITKTNFRKLKMKGVGRDEE